MIQNASWIIFTYFLLAIHGENTQRIIGAIQSMNNAYFIYNSFDLSASGSASLYSLKWIQRRISIIIQNKVLQILIVLSDGLFFRNSINLNMFCWLLLTFYLYIYFLKNQLLRNIYILISAFKWSYIYFKRFLAFYYIFI